MTVELALAAAIGLTVLRYVVLGRLDRRHPVYPWVAFGFGFVPPLALLGFAATITKTAPLIAVVVAGVAFGFIAFVAITIHRLGRDPAELDAWLGVLRGGNVSVGLRRVILALTVVVAVLVLLSQLLIPPH